MRTEGVVIEWQIMISTRDDYVLLCCVEYTVSARYPFRAFCMASKGLDTQQILFQLLANVTIFVIVGRGDGFYYGITLFLKPSS